MKTLEMYAFQFGLTCLTPWKQWGWYNMIQHDITWSNSIVTGSADGMKWLVVQKGEESLYENQRRSPTFHAPGSASTTLDRSAHARGGRFQATGQGSQDFYIFVKQWMLEERTFFDFFPRRFDLTPTSSTVLVLRLRTKTKPLRLRRLLRKKSWYFITPRPSSAARKQHDELEATAVLGLAEDGNCWPLFQSFLFRNPRLVSFFREPPKQKKLPGGIKKRLDQYSSRTCAKCSWFCGHLDILVRCG